MEVLVTGMHRSFDVVDGFISDGLLGPNSLEQDRF
jgi:hypothetical protein